VPGSTVVHNDGCEMIIKVRSVIIIMMKYKCGLIPRIWCLEFRVHSSRESDNPDKYSILLLLKK
jgi:hypothetical protein